MTDQPLDLDTTYAKRTWFDAQNFASCVRAARRFKSVHEIGELIGVSGSTISRVERCVSGPDIHTFGKLCEWMRIDPKEFFFVEDEPE